ncbi:MAG: hypothetical protein XXXJIFNMEKO3_01032 [Candidatus Erwinia impunctatus]|nr:hypothetical protein XXXJIFNMEKO_01032 [Culicoides impunctatus]
MSDDIFNRVLCNQSHQYRKVKQLIYLGLAFSAIAEITGVSQNEIERIHATATPR